MSVSVLRTQRQANDIVFSNGLHLKTLQSDLSHSTRLRNDLTYVKASLGGGLVFGKHTSAREFRPTEGTGTEEIAVRYL